uniref:Uncharacterized protein n=1 Tax=Arundo donax TaxID=35708 RepID=A0A0A9BSZ8_ARUDO
MFGIPSPSPSLLLLFLLLTSRILATQLRPFLTTQIHTNSPSISIQPEPPR